MTFRLPRTAAAGCMALAAATLSFLPVPGLPPAAAQEDGRDAEIRALAETIAGADDARAAWGDSIRLSGFGSKAAATVADAAGNEDATPLGRTALARVLLGFRERDRAAPILLKVAEQADAPVEVRVDAIRLLAQTNDDWADRIQAILDDALNGRIRAACASTLWRLTKEPAAKTPLREMLRSDDPDLRAEGAISLAEIGDFSADVQEALNQFRAEPTDRGRLADLLLQKEAWEKVGREGQHAAPAAAAPTGIEALFEEMLRTLREHYVEPNELDLKKLWDGAAHGFVSGVGEPHTDYQDIEERDVWTDQLTKRYSGIGAYVGLDQDGIFSITRPMFGGPAWKSNLRAGTRILRIDEWDTVGHSVDDIVKRLRGPTDTQVRILIHRRGWKEPQELTITRRPISVPTVNAAILPGKVGYVLVDNFAEDTANEFRKALRRFEEDGATSLVVDLRGNPGGYLNVAELMGEALLPGDKLVHETRGRGEPGQDARYVTRGTSSQWARSVPLAVLVNEGSASASEILSGAIQKNGRGRVVGTRTFGKGSVQNTFYLYTQPFAEPFTDSDGNGRWNPPEDFRDVNGNSAFDDGEPYRDANGNGRWDGGEKFDDRNGNGRFDAPAVKITIARWYVGSRPGSFELNPHRKQMIVGGRRVFLGGIEPDFPVAPEDFEGWRAEETGKLDRSDAFDRYLGGPDHPRFAEKKDDFVRLATNDTRNPSDWPGFDDFYRSLDTKLSRDEVWYWLHLRMRDEASNAAGRVLVGDFVVDQQLQGALRDLMDRESGTALRATPEYAFIASRTFEVPPTYDKEALAKARPVVGEDAAR